MSAALSLIVHRGKSQTGRQGERSFKSVHRGKSQTGRQGECSFKSHCPQRKDTQGDKVSAALSLVVHRGKSFREIGLVQL